MIQAPAKLTLVDDSLLAARALYQRFLERSVAASEVWGLKDDQGYVQFACQGTVCLPVWTDKREAGACADEEWEGCEPVAIPMKLWVGQWLSNMARKNAQLVISPNEHDDCVMIDPQDIQQDTLATLQAANIRF